MTAPIPVPVLALVGALPALTGAASGSAAEAQAQPTTGVAPELVLTPAVAAELARANNENVQAERAALVATEDETRADQAFLYPQLDAQAGVTRRSDQAVIGPLGRTLFRDQSEYQAGVRLEQLIWAQDIHGSSRDLRRETIRQQRAELASIGRDVARLARDALADWALAQATVTIAEERLAQRRDERQRTVDLADPAVGLATTLDVGQADINLIDIEDQLLAARAGRDRARFAIARLIARPAGDFRIDYELAAVDEIDGLLLAARQAVPFGPDIAALEAAGETLAARARQLGSGNLPSLSGFGEFGAVGEEADELHDSWAAGLSLTWELSDGGDRFFNRQALQARRRELQQRRAALIRERQTRLDQLAVRVDSLAERLPQLERAVAIAHDNYEAALANYEQGLIDLTRLGDFSLAIGESRFRLARLLHEQVLVANELRALAE